MKDTIDRQEAIDAVAFGITYAKAFDLKTGEAKNLFEKENEALAKAVERIKELSPVQPEPLTGKEKMIFLAAMAKEENICKQIDDEYRDCELYEDSLVRACQEIERKVRGALWT